jgi:hypothetical protein
MNFDFTALGRNDCYKLLLGAVISQPIARTTTRDENGAINAAPFSFFNIFRPDTLGISIGNGTFSGLSKEFKDTLINTRATREFVVNLVPFCATQKMVVTSIPFFRVAALGFLLLPLTCKGAHAQPRGELESLPDLLNLLYLVVVEPLLPLLAGAGLFMLTRSHLIAAGLSALGFGAWGAWYFSRLSLDGPLSGALYGFGVDGIASGLVALAGSGYVHLIGAEARRLGTERTAIAHAVGIAFAAMAFVLLLVTHGSDKVGIGLYLVLLALSLGVSAATGSFGGVVATMALALIAMVHGVWGAALASGVRDAGQAYIAIFYVPPLLAPVLATAAIGRWLGGSLRARRSDDRPG